MCSNNNKTGVSAVLTPPLSPPSVLQQYECAICKAIYKSKAGLTCHKNIVKKYNERREDLYTLPSEAITEFKAHLVHVIQNKLKGIFLSRVDKLFLFLA
ncbi:hypothetical protein RclHR1_28380001 [Rhizophagus clarus]|uniref:C2H2-type domain-containing protein n=1 Tax=Rhizophagus clarus TaxID=94130 RepID=A0A2Z6R7D9_9GLOM|nr:hypothetical protein RclHR1_28380001 [Rhizophagus clarus]